MSVKKFSEILKKIHENKISGTLTLIFPKWNRYIYVSDGEISYLKSEHPEERLGHILVKQNLLSENELEEALKKSKESGHVLGEYLVNTGKITVQELQQSLKNLFLMIIEACFLEEMKDINFVEKDIRIDKNLFIEVKTGNLVLETFRKIDHKDFEDFFNEHKNDKPKLSEKIIFDYKNLNLNPLEGFILSRVDGKLTLEEIKKIAFTDEKTFYKTIFALNFLGLLDFGNNDEENYKNKPQTTEKTAQKEIKKEQKQTKESEYSEKNEDFIKEVQKLYINLPTINYYELLSVDYYFEKDELKDNFHKLVKKYHPDSHSNLKEIRHQLQSIIATITKAYRTLRSDYERAEYNKRMHIKPPEEKPKKQEEKKKEEATKQVKQTDPKEELKKQIENFVKAGFYYDAVQLLESACKQYKDDIYFFKSLGNIYYRTPTKLKQAIHYLEKAHKMDRKDTDILQNLAGAYKKVGLYKEAYTYYKKLLSLDPDNPDAKEFLGEVENKGSIFSKFKNLFSKD